MTCDHVMPLLNELVDTTLPVSAVADVERHLEDCTGCRAALADLRAIRQTAATLDRLTPPASVWERVATAITSEPPRLEASSAPQQRVGVETGWQPRLVLAAAAILVLSTVVGLWMRESFRPVTLQPAVNQANASTEAGGMMSAEDDVVRAAERDYQQAIMGLEKVAQSESHALDPDIAATLNQNIAIVDRAIFDARQALEAEPQVDELRAGLLEAFRSKLELLEQMVLLINEMRQGNPEIVGSRQ